VRNALVFCILTLSFCAVAAPLGIQHIRLPFDLNPGTRCLRIEVLDDDLVHFETFERREPRSSCLPETDMIWITPMVNGSIPMDDQKPTERLQYFKKNRRPYQVTYAAGYQGPTVYQRLPNGFETKDLRVTVRGDSQCVDIFDKTRQAKLTQICSSDLDKDDKYLTMTKESMRNFYGVSDQFLPDNNRNNTPDGDWNGFRFDVEENAGKPGHMRGPNYYDGAPSTSQFPMVYNLGTGFLNYGLFFDHQYRMTMDFTAGDKYTYKTYGDEIRFFVMSGENLKDLRKDYMELTGTPPVPPRSQFGYWTSKFGFGSFDEVEDEVKALRANGFPLDGVALDLQWFGGKFGNPDIFRMGVLQFVTAMLDHPQEPNRPSFDSPETKIPYFYNQYGVHFLPIEEMYIDERLDEFKAMAFSEFRESNPGFKGLAIDDGCFLARVNLDKGGGWQPALVTVDFKRTSRPGEINWWGRGSIWDASNPFARRFWHQLKRMGTDDTKPSLLGNGIVNFWLDLVEPEMFDEFAYYYGFPELFREILDEKGENVIGTHTVQMHGDLHNFLGGLFQPMGIAEGMADVTNGNRLKPMLKRFYGGDYNFGPRHWTLFRAGTVGSQRYGGLWSGDTYSNTQNANAQFRAQTQMSLLMDYFSGDSGGFFHINDGKTPTDPKEAVLWKQWFAASSLMDIPLRPHGWALTKPGEPDISFGAHVRGHLESNRANAWRRYELIPYMYSLAHRAHLFAEAMYPPLFYHFQDDMNVRTDGTEKMMGGSLLFKVLAAYEDGKPEVKNTAVYLPEGTWVDYENLEWISMDSGGLAPHNIDLFRKDRVPYSEPASTYYYFNPLFAREGAIIPKMYVDNRTMNALGKRWGENPRQELITRIFSSPTETQFEVYEDDGVSRGYLNNEVQVTTIHQKLSPDSALITIDPVRGSYVGTPVSRKNTVELVVNERKVRAQNGVVIIRDGAQQPLGMCDFGNLPSGSPQFQDAVKKFDHDQQTCWYQANGRLIRARTESIGMGESKQVQFIFE
jgi:alpha-glucosidase (family GH31 glycosyl hydrolase)